MVFQLRTFQGVRYGLFHYNSGSSPGGVADFDSMEVVESDPHGLIRPIPYGRTITLSAHGRNAALLRQGELLLAPKKQGASRFKVVDRGLGRVALGMGNRFVSVQSPQQVVMRAGRPGDAETFQWIETPTGELVLMSLSTNRFMRIDPGTGLISADSPGPKSDDSDGDRFDLSIGFSASALRPN